MRLPVLALLAALAPSLAAQTTYRLNPIDSVSVDPANRVWRDNRHRAYNNPSGNYDVHGLLQFDLSSIPDSARITSMKLTCTLENAFGSPRNNPVVNLHYSADDAWTRATATGASGALGAVVTANQQNFQLPTHAFVINVAAHNWSTDLADDRLTLAIDNVNPAYSYVYFYGSGGSPTGPAPVLEIVTGACGGVIASFGTGGKDSTSTTVAALGTGCPQVGNTIGLGMQLGTGNQSSVSVFLGGSDQVWGTVRLPLDLGPFGAPGNTIYASLDFLLGTRTGSGTVALAVPNNSILKGQSFFAQSVAFDGRANALGLVFGPGQKVTLAP